MFTITLWRSRQTGKKRCRGTTFDEEENSVKKDRTHQIAAIRKPATRIRAIRRRQRPDTSFKARKHRQIDRPEVKQKRKNVSNRRRYTLGSSTLIDGRSGLQDHGGYLLIDATGGPALSTEVAGTLEADPPTEARLHASGGLHVRLHSSRGLLPRSRSIHRGCWYTEARLHSTGKTPSGRQRPGNSSNRSSTEESLSKICR